MIISYIQGGIGNQLFQYAAGRRLAHKHNTELKLDIAPYLLRKTSHTFFALDRFNINVTVAVPEEIDTLKKGRRKKISALKISDQNLCPKF